MEPILELGAKLQEIQSKLDALVNSPNPLTAEQQAEHDTLAADFDATAARLDAAKANEARKQKLSRLVVQPTSTRVTDAASAIVQVSANEPRIPATVRRFGTLKNFKGVKEGMAADERAYRFSQYAQALMSRQCPGLCHFPQAEKFVADNWGGLQMAASASGDAAGYGYLIFPEFSNEIVDLRNQYGIVRRLFKTVPMSSDTWTGPKRLSGLTSYFVAEGSAATESAKTWTNYSLTAKKLMVLSRANSEVNEDTRISWADDLMGEIALAFATKEDECGINGDGTSTYGGIYGLRPKLLGTATAAVVTGAGNSWSALTMANFRSTVALLPQHSIMGASWLVSRAFYHTVMWNLLAAEAYASVMEVQQGTDPYSRPYFLGFPVDISESMPSSTATSQLCAILGNYANGCSFGDRRGETMAFSTEATVGGESMFERDQLAVKASERFDIALHSIGDASTVEAVVGLKTSS